MRYAQWVIIRSRIYAWAFLAVLVLAWVALGISLYGEREVDFGFGLLMFVVISFLVAFLQFKGYAVEVRRLSLRISQDCLGSREDAAKAG